MTIQGSTLVDSEYYDIVSYEYGNATTGDAETSTIGYTLQGYHPFVKMKFESNVGNIGNVLAR